MFEGAIIRPEIALQDFFPIFLSSALVIIFGLAYVGIYTLVRMELLKRHWDIVGYAFWVLQTYCLYLVGHLIKSEPFTMNILMVAMVGYLFIPHFIYFLLEKTHDVYKHETQH